jgi:hypothetical protein
VWELRELRRELAAEARGTMQPMRFWMPRKLFSTTPNPRPFVNIQRKSA